jgi:hypothetical protein
MYFILTHPSTSQCSLARPYGGDEEDRTPDPLRARQVLSQLSYTPILIRGPELSSLISIGKGPHHSLLIKLIISCYGV